MTVAELQELEEVKALIARGQQFGVLTQNEVATAVAELRAGARSADCLPVSGKATRRPLSDARPARDRAPRAPRRRAG